MPQNDKLTAVRIKQENGEYGPQIPVAAKARNVQYKNTEYSVEDIIGDVDISKGTLQQQIGKATIEDVQNWVKDNLDFTAPVAAYDSSTEYNTGDIVIYNNSFYRCKQDQTTGETPSVGSDYWDKLNNFVIDESLSMSGAAADAYQAGKIITVNNEIDSDVTKLHFNTTANDSVNILTTDDIDLNNINDTIKNVNNIVGIGGSHITDISNMKKYNGYISGTGSVLNNIDKESYKYIVIPINNTGGTVSLTANNSKYVYMAALKSFEEPSGESSSISLNYSEDTKWKQRRMTQSGQSFGPQSLPTDCNYLIINVMLNNADATPTNFELIVPGKNGILNELEENINELDNTINELDNNINNTINELDNTIDELDNTINNDIKVQINNIKKKIVDIPELIIEGPTASTYNNGNFELRNGFLGSNQSGYAWTNTTSDVYKHVYIELPPERSGGMIHIETSSKVANLAAVTAYGSQAGSNQGEEESDEAIGGRLPKYSGPSGTPDWTVRININKNTASWDYSVPSNAKGLIVNVVGSSDVVAPDVFRIVYPPVTSSFTDIQNYLDPIRQGPEYYVRDSLDGCEIHNGNIGGGGVWNHINTYKHVIIPVIGGMEVSFTASTNGQADFAVLKEYTAPSSDEDPIHYCGGDMWDHKLMQSGGSPYTSLLPYDARYIAIVVNKDGTDTTPTSFSLTYTDPGPVKWCALGDSITEGTYSYYVDGGGTGSKTLRDKGWVRQVALINHWDLTNLGDGGTGFLNQDEHGAGSEGYSKARNHDFTPYDLVTISYGINDWKADMLLGTINDDGSAEEPTTTLGAMKATIEAIMTSNPACKIIVILPMNIRGYNGNNGNQRFGTKSNQYARGFRNTESPSMPKLFNMPTLDEFADKMIEVCNLYGIQYIDMTRYSPLNIQNMEVLLPDGVHPSIEAHRLIARQLAKKITF